MQGEGNKDLYITSAAGCTLFLVSLGFESAFLMPPLAATGLVAVALSFAGSLVAAGLVAVALSLAGSLACPGSTAGFTAFRDAIPV